MPTPDEDFAGYMEELSEAEADRAEQQSIINKHQVRNIDWDFVLVSQVLSNVKQQQLIIIQSNRQQTGMAGHDNRRLGSHKNFSDW